MINFGKEKIQKKILLNDFRAMTKLEIKFVKLCSVDKQKNILF
jgi:hypothetical protein